MWKNKKEGGENEDEKGEIGESCVEEKGLFMRDIICIIEIDLISSIQKYRLYN